MAPGAEFTTADNFTGVAIYDFTDAYLRYGTVKKLAEVLDELRDLGMGLKIWDAVRPVSAQFRLWEVYPDPVCVANPNTGFSSHSRGNTVDITLVKSDGTEVQMPPVLMISPRWLTGITAIATRWQPIMPGFWKI